MNAETNHRCDHRLGDVRALMAIGALGLCLAVFASRARAWQDAGPGGAAERVDAYVNDSFEAIELLERITDHAKRGEWIESAKLTEVVQDSYGDRLVRVGPGAYRSAAVYVRDVISQWPDKGVRAYRQWVDPRAEAALSGAMERRDPGALVRLWNRYASASAGPSIAEAAFEVLVERGAFAEAESVADQASKLYRRRDELSARFVSRSAIACALAGREDAAEGRLARYETLAGKQTTIAWKGRQQSVFEVVRNLVSESRAAGVGLPSTDWPAFGGNNAHTRAGRFKLDALASLWQIELDPLSSGEGDKDGDGLNAFHRLKSSGRWLTAHGIAVGKLLIVQRESQVWAIRVNSGSVAWHWRGVDDAPPRTSYASDDSSLGEWFAPACDGGRVYVCVGSEVTPYYGYDQSGDVSAIACLDVRTGREMWRTAMRRLGDGFVKASFGSSPMVVEGGVVAVARHRRTFGFEDAYLIRLDADDGHPVYRVHLGSASTGGFGYRRPTLSNPASDGATVFAAANLGTVAAVDALSGEIQWLRCYDRQPEAEWRGTMRSSSQDVMPWHYNPVRCTPRQVICGPMDCTSILVLDRENGEIERQVTGSAAGNPLTIVGLDDDRVYAIGEGVACYGLDDGREAWSGALAPEFEWFGRPILSGGDVLVPTRTALSAFDAATGARRVQGWDDPRAAGNLLALDDRLVVFGVDWVSAFGRKNDVWAQLRSDMAARPDDPAPALDLAEIAFRSGDHRAALAVLDEAIERASGSRNPFEDEVSRRLFGDCLSFASHWPDDIDHDAASRLYEQAGRFAPDTEAHVRYRFDYAAFSAANDMPANAIELYQQVLADRSLRDVVIKDSSGDVTASNAAKARIQSLIEQTGRGVYAKFDAQAADRLRQAADGRDLDLLDRLLTETPHAVVVPDAMRLMGDILLESGRAKEAAGVLVNCFLRFPDHDGSAETLGKIAEAYASSGRIDLAWRWANERARRFPDQHAYGQAVNSAPTGDAQLYEAGRRLVDIHRPALTPSLSQRFVIGFPDEVSLLAPILPPVPESDWSRFLLYEDGSVHAFNSRDGGEAWPGTAEFAVQPELLLATGEWFLLATPHELFCVDAETGIERWRGGRKPVEADDPNADPERLARFVGHAYRRGRLVSLRDDGRAILAEVATGRPIWQRVLDQKPGGAPILTEQRVAYVGAESPPTAVCVLDAGTGDRVRTIETDEDAHPLRLHLTDEGRLIVVTLHSVSAFDVEKGQPLWRARLAGNVVDASICFGLTAVYLLDDENRAYAISLYDGSTVWRSESILQGEGGRVRAELLDGMMFVLSESGAYALDEISGRIMWRSEEVPEIRLVKDVLTNSFVIGVDESEDASGPHTAQFFAHRPGAGENARHAVVDLGDVDDVRRIGFFDGCVVIQQARNLLGWTAGPDQR